MNGKSTQPIAHRQGRPRRAYDTRRLRAAAQAVCLVTPLCIHRDITRHGERAPSQEHEALGLIIRVGVVKESQAPDLLGRAVKIENRGLIRMIDDNRGAGIQLLP